jgi:hypothetical protein
MQLDMISILSVPMADLLPVNEVDTHSCAYQSMLEGSYAWQLAKDLPNAYMNGQPKR